LDIINLPDNDISMRGLPHPSKLSTAMETSLAPHFLKLTQSQDPQTALSLMEEVCLLTPIRKGSFGVEGLNRSMEGIMRNQNPSLGRGIHFSGKPVLIMENNYTQNLFNGDQGIILASTDEGGELFAYFRKSGEEGIRRFPLSALPAFEPAYALTVHKSQGSEYRHVIFILPPGDSPIMSRELVYTAISRSRETVEIWGQEDTFKQAVSNRTRSTSGILDFLTKA
jgi:exodeoxyribonuclease V alpha subunit